MHTQGLFEITDDERSHSRAVPLHSQNSIFARPSRGGLARAIYPTKVDYESSSSDARPPGKPNMGGNITQASNNHNATRTTTSGNFLSSPIDCGAESPAPLNWDSFSFTPGFLKPLSVKEL
jgi:hypothetical protein